MICISNYQEHLALSINSYPLNHFPLIGSFAFLATTQHQLFVQVVLARFLGELLIIIRFLIIIIRFLIIILFMIIILFIILFLIIPLFDRVFIIILFLIKSLFHPLFILFLIKSLVNYPSPFQYHRVYQAC
jgi:hypothetical protein